MSQADNDNTIDIHCGICGLYLCFTSEYMGGKGRCPRCGSVLRLPQSYLSVKRNIKRKGVRFYAYSEDGERVPPRKTRVVYSKDGPSVLYRCTGCRNEYETLLFERKYYNLCPLCGSPGLPVEKNMEKTGS